MLLKGLAIAGVVASLAPIWRSGERRGLNLFQFAYEHSSFSRQRQWVNLEDKQTHEKIWVELEEGAPKSHLLYLDGRGKLTAHIDPTGQNSNSGDFTELSDIQGNVRRDNKYYSLKSFITPNEPLIRDLAATLYRGGNFIADAQDFVHSEVEYKSDVGDFWQTSLETLGGVGDCEDSAILLCSILRNYIPAEEVYCVCGEWKREGHMWVVADWKVIESTHGSEMLVREEEYKPDVFFNDKYIWGRPSDFDFVLVGERYCFLGVR